LVNTTTEDGQALPSVIGLPDNRFVVTWGDSSGDLNGIRGQAFDGDGASLGEEFLVTSEDVQGERPSVTDFSNGDFVVVWQNDPSPFTITKAPEIAGQIFDASGTATPTQTIDGTVDADDLSGGAAAEVITGLDGQDELRGGGGGDQVYGNRGADEVYGNQGDDLVFGGRDADLVFGGQGVDQIYGNLGNDQVYGNLDDDLLFGGQDDDDLFGGGGADQIWLLDAANGFRVALRSGCRAGWSAS
jgi:Ca2+-binding RTX toxin-like protein